MLSLSADEARRIALAAQGFADPRPRGRIDARHVRRVLRRTQLLQIDSVNVLARAHYLPLFSRLGPYPMPLLDRLAYRDRELFEYWGHEASLIPVGDHPLFRWKMRAAAERDGRYRRWAEQRAPLLAAVLEQVRARGPIAASDLDGHAPRSSPWWGWNEGKTAFEWLFLTGRVTTASRRNFERVYDLTERVVPAEVLALPTPAEDDAKAELLRRAAGALGVGTARDLGDYFRLKHVTPLLRRLVADGALLEVRVEGWRRLAYLTTDLVAPPRIDARALLAPFDPVVWERQRTERLFGFRYRIEIYVPAPKRVHGYYVLPFLLGDRLVARVDLKADRNANALLVPAAHAEPGAEPGKTAEALAGELRSMASWLGLERVRVGRRGDLAAGLGRCIKQG